MSKKLNKRILACVTAAFTLTVMCGAPAVAFAADGSSVTKEETVYVVTDSSGDATDTIVSDHLTNDESLESIADKSNLKKIENVKGDEKFTRDGNNITWAAAGNDIYYQGKTDNKAPVTMDVSYYLDGQKVNGKKLKDASGSVKIVIRYSNSTKVPFLAMTGFIANDNTFKNVKVSSGKVINDGDKQIVACLAAPGLCAQMDVSQDKLGFGDNVVITGEAKNFDVEDMMTIVTGDVSALDFEDIDIDELDSSITKLDNSAKKLKDGSKKVKDGSKKIKDGTAQLKSKLETAATGASQVYGGLLQIQGTAKKVNDGVDNINKTASDLNVATSKIKDGYIDSGVYAAIKASIDKDGDLTAEQKTAYKKAVDDSATCIKGADSAFAGIATATIASSDPANPTLKNATSGIVSGVDNQLVPGAKKLSDGLNEGKGGANQLASGAEDLNDGASELNDGMNKFYQEGIKKLVDMYNDELKGTVDGLEGALDAGKGYKTFTKLSNGMDGSVKFIYKTTISE